MGNCEDCLYYHLGVCEDAEEGCKADCFVDFYVYSHLETCGDEEDGYE